MLVQVRYAKDKYGYTAQTAGKTIMFLISQKYLGNFFNVALPWLMYWKIIIPYQIMLSFFYLVFTINRRELEKNLNVLKNGMIEDRSSFGITSPSPCKQDFIKPIWLGPKISNAKVIPPLPHLTF